MSYPELSPRANGHHLHAQHGELWCQEIYNVFLLASLSPRARCLTLQHLFFQRQKANTTEVTPQSHQLQRWGENVFRGTQLRKYWTWGYVDEGLLANR